MPINNLQQITDTLFKLLMDKRRISLEAEKTCSGLLCTACSAHHKSKIQLALAEQRPLSLILPAFPAKSANRKKTLSEKPDRGEILGLIHLNELCQNMQQHHNHGIKLIICSDGRVFNDLVLVNDAGVDTYQQGIKQIITEHQLTHLTTFSLDEVYPCHNYQSMRELLMIEYSQTLESLKQQIKENPDQLYQFNGIHRFIIEDRLYLQPEHSKNKIRQQAKEISYEVIRRSNAWSRLLENYFPKAVRLSIHPQPCGSEKMGIHLLPSTNRWGTPWHNVLLKSSQGWQLIKREEAERLGAQLNDDHYVLEHKA